MRQHLNLGVPRANNAPGIAPGWQQGTLTEPASADQLGYPQIDLPGWSAALFPMSDSGSDIGAMARARVGSDAVS